MNALDFIINPLARIFYQAACSFAESALFSLNFRTNLHRCGDRTLRWPRSRLSFAPVRTHARAIDPGYDFAREHVGRDKIRRDFRGPW